MAKMGAALAAGDFGAQHLVAAILVLGNAFSRYRRGKAGPAAAGVEFGGGGEQDFVAADATIEPIFMAIPVVAGEGSFGAFLAGDMELHFAELRAPFGERVLDRWGVRRAL